MVTNRDIYDVGRLTARPDTEAKKADFKRGVQRLGLDDQKDGFLYVPDTYSQDKPAALAVMLHGAGAPAEQGLSLLQRYADAHNMILIAPASREYSWDIIASDAFGADVIFIDQALEQAFSRYHIDPTRIAIGGFSDGASYGLCLGLTNGDLFTHLLAFSPGFAYTITTAGEPDVFISHGIKDAVLPVDPCSRRIVAQLQRRGLQVNYQEFNGAHEVPELIRRSGVDWFTGNNGSESRLTGND